MTMLSYRRTRSRNRLAALTVALLTLAAVLWVVEWTYQITGGREPFLSVIAIVLAGVLVWGVSQWPWLRAFREQLQAEERRAWARERKSISTGTEAA